MTNEEFKKIKDLNDIIIYNQLRIDRYNIILNRLFNIQNEVISMSSDSYEEVDGIDIPKQLIIDIIKEKIEKDEQDLRNAKIEFTNIKLTTGFEQQVTSRARPTW